MVQFCRILLWLAIVATFVRGLFVFDMGLSAEQSYPTASAICLVGAILAAVFMLRTPTTKEETGVRPSMYTILAILGGLLILVAVACLILFMK